MLIEPQVPTVSGTVLSATRHNRFHEDMGVRGGTGVRPVQLLRRGPGPEVLPGRCQRGLLCQGPRPPHISPCAPSQDGTGQECSGGQEPASVQDTPLRPSPRAARPPNSVGATGECRGSRAQHVLTARRGEREGKCTRVPGVCGSQEGRRGGQAEQFTCHRPIATPVSPSHHRKVPIETTQSPVRGPHRSPGGGPLSPTERGSAQCTRSSVWRGPAIRRDQ